MDWIEQWFGLNPDGGDGSLEWLLAGGLVLAGLALLCAAHPVARAALARMFGTRPSRANDSRG